MSLTTFSVDDYVTKEKTGAKGIYAHRVHKIIKIEHKTMMATLKMCGTVDHITQVHLAYLYPALRSIIRTEVRFCSQNEGGYITAIERGRNRKLYQVDVRRHYHDERTTREQCVRFAVGMLADEGPGMVADEGRTDRKLYQLEERMQQFDRFGVGMVADEEAASFGVGMVADESASFGVGMVADEEADEAADEEADEVGRKHALEAQVRPGKRQCHVDAAAAKKAEEEAAAAKKVAVAAAKKAEEEAAAAKKVAVAATVVASMSCVLADRKSVV